MLIEQKTSYAYKLKYLENPTFDKVRGFAKSFIDDLPKELVDELYSQLDRGVVQIDSEPQMLVYLYSFGNMHQAKLNKAFENIPEILFDQPEINIIDYGCGQAIGTMCYVDFIRQKGVSQKVKRVTLIEPSEICLKRAALHVSAFCPDEEFVTLNKEFDDLNAADIVCDEEIPTLHILSNVLDLEFDLDRFAELISDNLKGYNQFVCVGPYFGFSDKDKRMENLYLLLNGEEDFCKIYDKNELNPNRPWTAQIRCFSVGELEELSTKVTKEEIENGVEDEFGVVYSRDGKRLLNGNRELTTYVIKNGTKVICDWAFCECAVLQQITIPNSVKSIGAFAFNKCVSLKQITIPNSVTSIEHSAFEWCRSLQQITIPNSVTNIGWAAFAYCDSLKQIAIPNSVMSIGDSTFEECIALQQITIPNSVTSIGEFAFNNCFSLKQITIPNSVTSIGESAFRDCESLLQITIPNSVTSIGIEAFYGCKYLYQINIPNSITSIGRNLFLGCSFLKVKSQSLRFIVENRFLIDGEEHTIISYIGDNEKITIPNSVMIIGDNAFDGFNFLQQITIPNSVTSIGVSAFDGCKSLQQITIPNSVTSIGGEAFNGCESLQRITIPDSVTSIGDGAFRYCFSLQQITILNSVTSIGGYAFCRCSSLQQITIPNSVTSIGEKAFCSCSSLQQIIISNSVMSIGKSVFYECTSLQRIIIPEGSEEKFKQMLPEELWDKLYYLKKAVVVKTQGEDDLPF